MLQDPKCQTHYGHVTYLLYFYVDILRTVRSSPARVCRAKEDERLIVSLVASQVFVAGSWPINCHLIAIFVLFLRHSPSIFCNSLSAHVYLTGGHCSCSFHGRSSVQSGICTTSLFCIYGSSFSLCQYRDCFLEHLQPVARHSFGSLDQTFIIDVNSHYVEEQPCFSIALAFV